MPHTIRDFGELTIKELAPNDRLVVWDESERAQKSIKIQTILDFANNKEKTTSNLTFKQFSETNRKRCVTDFNHLLKDWTAAEWSNAMAGECGEACNLTKKLLRGDKEIDYVKEIGKELADVICYADLVAAKLGIDLGEAIIQKFNEVSDRRGSKIKL